MLLFEIRKIFSRFKNRFAALLLLIVLGITSILAVNKVEYVDENGNSTTGITAAANLRAVREPWSGYLTEEVLKKAVEDCIETEELVKTGRLGDQIGVELLIMKYSG